MIFTLRPANNALIVRSANAKSSTLEIGSPMAFSALSPH
jgi:hypothetical protein